MRYAIISNIRTGESYTLENIMDHTRYTDNINGMVVMSGYHLGKKVTIRFDIANYFVEIYEDGENSE